MARSLFGIGRFDDAERQAIKDEAVHYLKMLRSQKLERQDSADGARW